MPDDDFEYIEPPPPTGDVTITQAMTPCDVHVMINGTVTLESGVKPEQVEIHPADGVSVAVVGSET